MSSQEPVVGVDDPGHRKGTSLSDLPNELWVAIANSLDSEEDRDTLNVLCLTSRRWLFPAQQNLYGDFVIQGRDDRDILAFAQSLQDPTNSRCRFVTYIHTIRLVGTFDDSAAINLVHVVSLVKLLPSLRFLCLDYVTLKADKRDFSESLEDPTAVSRYPCERIDLKHVIFRGISFPLFINMFAGRHITLDAITCKNRRRAAIQYDDDDVKTVAISPPSLSGLRSLNVLSWYHFLLEEEEELPDLLMSACADGEIRAFRIPHALGCFRTPGTGPKPPEEFLLTKCRNLRYLQLDYSIVRSFASAGRF
ncbi:hypothetical protein BXZ70DRAFT_238341 [Cristinia sonorae]|uniref:F-box domain-containing protein n=1 Tax=Cristinia sonorae TaxID=1940300 RepID=A0A8K0XP59_9AGAR|nr:hypothetical protein BXZ70DRAFT_238341 [Cristinia sonorae]